MIAQIVIRFPRTFCLKPARDCSDTAEYRQQFYGYYLIQFTTVLYDLNMMFYALVATETFN